VTANVHDAVTVCAVVEIPTRCGLAPRRIADSLWRIVRHRRLDAMPTKSSAPTSSRLSASVKLLPNVAARKERRSQIAMPEVMVVDWCQRHRVKLARGGAK
jgi:hypothetical protein